MKLRFTWLSQLAGAFAGVASAHLMFGLPLFFASNHSRHGAAQLWSEAVATFGLMFVIWGCSRFRPSATAYAVGAYITSAYWFTASTSFANPAVTLARSASDTFAGIRPADAPGFVAAQLFGALGGDRPFPLAGFCSSQPSRVVRTAQRDDQSSTIPAIRTCMFSNPRFRFTMQPAR